MILPGVQDRDSLSDQSESVFWQVSQLPNHNSFWIIEAAGSYRQIGQSLGKWYQNQGFEPKQLTPEEVNKARLLREFYQDVNPEINNQIAGVYDYFKLDYSALTYGVPVWSNQEEDVLLPGLFSPHSCSVVFTGPDITSGRQSLLGRNYDFPDEIEGFTLMFTSPEGGYATAVITTMEPGFSAADGINSEGLALGMASIVDMGYQADGNGSLISSFYYRYILEHSKNVDEAIDLLEMIPISFLPSIPRGIISHILIADKSGASAVVEFLPEGTVVNRADEPYQILTNNLWDDTERRRACQRYARAEKILEETPLVDLDLMIGILADLRRWTQYSVVYDLDSLELILSTREDDFKSSYEFSLQEFIQKADN
jgi:predicted choloylglycine hydrolase